MSERQTYDQFLKRLIFTFFNTLIFLTPFIFTWFNQELFEFNKMIFVYAVSIIITALWLLRMLLNRQLLFKKITANYFALAFLISQVLATIFSIHQRSSIFGYYTRFNGGLLSTISYLALFFAFVNNLEKKHLPIIFENLILSGFLISLYAIPEHFGHSMSCLIVSKRFDVSCWVQDVQNRVFATFGQPNWLAAFLVMLIPLNISFLIDEKRIKKKTLGRSLLLVISLLSMTLALLFTKSRSGFLALAASLAFYLVFYLLKVKVKNAKKLLFPLGLIAAIILLFGSPYTPSLKALINKETKQETVELNSDVPIIELGGSKSSDIRKVVWKGAINVWRRYPIFGSGVETFAYSYYQDRPVEHNLLSEWDFLYNKAHNELLNYLATTGAVGLVAYLLLFLALGVVSYQLWQESDHWQESLAIFTAIIAMFISNFFGFSTVNSNLLFAIFAASLVILKQKNNQQEIKNNPLTTLDYLIGSIIVIAAVYCSSLNFKIWQADFFFTNGKNYLAANNYQEGLSNIQEAIEKSPKEALFYNELATNYAELAVAFAKENKATQSAQFAQAAIQTNDFVLQLNDRHLNFYKSRAKIFLRLGQLNDGFYQNGKRALETAIALSPTDAKLYYNLALVENVLGNKETAKEILEKTINMKANYLQAREELAKIYLEEGEETAATEEYQYILEKIDPKNAAALDFFEQNVTSEL